MVRNRTARPPKTTPSFVSSLSLFALLSVACFVAAVYQLWHPHAAPRPDGKAFLAFAWERWGAPATLLVGSALGKIGFFLVLKQRTAWGRGQASNALAMQKAQADADTARQQLEARAMEYATLFAEKQRLESAVERGQENASRRLRLLDAAVRNTNDVVMITEADPNMPPRVVFVNPAFERMTGYSPEEIRGRTPRLLQGPDTDPKTLAFLRDKLRSREPVQVEILNYRKDGTPFWVELSIQPMLDAGGWQTHWISVQRDVTDRKKASEQIQWQANHDMLTRLPNRKHYQERLTTAVADATSRGRSVGVLFFDLDRFKHVNDTLGHSAGDKLLQEVGARLSARLREEDTLARVGGDEFTVLLPHIAQPEQAASAARKLLEELRAPFHIEGHEIYMTASIGVSLAPEDGVDGETLLKNADRAMYRAKDEGRDGIRVYSEAMDTRTTDRLILESHLRHALEKEEFFLLYQPQVEAATGRIFGVEALIRWEHPVLGRVSPAQFIPLAEETGLIVEIGDWTLREAARQAAEWHKQGRALRMSVNLSARQFAQTNLTERVRDVLTRSGLPAEFFDLELTEGTLLRGSKVAESLAALKELGVRLSVDDFGTGYSSLSYFRTFPLDVLKIDRAFVSGLAEDRKCEVIARALIELAHGVGLEVIAEGVETEAQRAMLEMMNCDAIQGYLFSPPTTAREVEALADGVLKINPLTMTAGATATKAKPACRADDPPRLKMAA